MYLGERPESIPPIPSEYAGAATRRYCVPLSPHAGCLTLLPFPFIARECAPAGVPIARGTMRAATITIRIRNKNLRTSPPCPRPRSYRRGSDYGATLRDSMGDD